MLLVLFALIVACAGQADVVRGSATVRLDFTGFSNDVSVSTCDRATYANQGGRVNTYVVETTNFREPCQFVIQEGGAATFQITFNLANGDALVPNVASYRANLAIHLENYNPGEAGNTFCVQLRAQAQITDIEPNTFRVYCDQGPVSASRLPLSALTNNVVPSRVAYNVPVFQTTQIVTVWAQENTATTTSVVFTDGHTAQVIIVV